MLNPSLNKTQQIADFIGEKIIAGEMRGGERIQEVRLASELSVSRGSVREALLLLERRRLIEVIPRRGALVGSLTPADAREVMALLAMLDERYLTDSRLLDAADHFCREISPVLVGLAESARTGDVATTLEHRGSFYRQILQYAPQPAVALFDALLPTSQRIYHFLLTHTDFDLFDVARYYQALAVAMQQGCTERISELICAGSRRFDTLCDTHFELAGSQSF